MMRQRLIGVDGFEPETPCTSKQVLSSASRRPKVEATRGRKPTSPGRKLYRSQQMLFDFDKHHRSLYNLFGVCFDRTSEKCSNAPMLLSNTPSGAFSAATTWSKQSSPSCGFKHTRMGAGFCTCTILTAEKAQRAETVMRHPDLIRG